MRSRSAAVSRRITWARLIGSAAPPPPRRGHLLEAALAELLAPDEGGQGARVLDAGALRELLLERREAPALPERRSRVGLGGGHQAAASAGGAAASHFSR